jgi:superoxide dismutase, Fe-Mn family
LSKNINFKKTFMHTLPKLQYSYDALEPYMDAKTLEIHHTKHHQAYVDGLNAAEKSLQNMRENGDMTGLKAALKERAFHGAGHRFHTLFWENLSPEETRGQISESLTKAGLETFGSYEIFQKEFNTASITVEGSGWGMLGYRTSDKQLVILSIEKHQDLAQMDVIPLLVCDMWEHAYYLKYQNRRPEWLENFWSIVNWEVVNKRYEDAL